MRGRCGTTARGGDLTPPSHPKFNVGVGVSQGSDLQSIVLENVASREAQESIAINIELGGGGGRAELHMLHDIYLQTKVPHQ